MLDVNNHYGLEVACCVLMDMCISSCLCLILESYDQAQVKAARAQTRSDLGTEVSDAEDADVAQGRKRRLVLCIFKDV